MCGNYIPSKIKTTFNWCGINSSECNMMDQVHKKWSRWLVMVIFSKSVYLCTFIPQYVVSANIPLLMCIKILQPSYLLIYPPGNLLYRTQWIPMYTTNPTESRVCIECQLSGTRRALDGHSSLDGIGGVHVVEGIRHHGYVNRGPLAVHPNVCI